MVDYLSIGYRDSNFAIPLTSIMYVSLKSRVSDCKGERKLSVVYIHLADGHILHYEFNDESNQAYAFYNNIVRCVYEGSTLEYMTQYYMIKKVKGV